jgi:serine/threonine protein phosphatase PrpC
MIAVAKSHIGLVRSVNQDSHGIQMDSPYPLVIVADGMGGHQAGEVASSMAVETVQKFLLSEASSMKEEQVLDRITQSFQLANQKIYEHAQAEANKAGMGTTLVVSVLHKDKFWIGHIGDSRAYLFHNDMISQITEDHSLVHELVRSGQISLSEAEHHPQRHILTRALGTDPSIQIDLQEYHWEPDDILVLCSDGLTIHVSSLEMEAVLRKDISLEEKVSNLLDLALARGGHDNITIVAVQNDASSPERGDAK